MNTIQIQPKLVGFPIDKPTIDVPNPVEQPAEFLDYSFSETVLNQPWYRLREISGKIHDGGHIVEVPNTVTDDATFEAWLITELGVTKI